jgi:uncharacterized membrane protein
MKVNYSVELNCTPEKVWYWLGTPERAMKWQKSVSKTEYLEKTPDWVGTTFREKIGENGQSVEMRGVVTDYRENELLGMHLSGKYNMIDTRWRIERSGDNARLTVDSDVSFKGYLWILSVIVRPMFKKTLLRQMEDDVERLKELCEGGD